MTYRGTAGLRIAVLALSLVLPLSAHAISGSAPLTGSSVLALHGCGRHRGTVATLIVLADDGTWTAMSQEGPVFAGTYTPKGRSGRKFALVMDPASEQAFVADTAAEITTACELTGVVVSEVVPKVMKLSLNKQFTSAKLLVRYRFRGASDQGSGAASIKIAGKGTWTAG
jgi:hypothetical protein